MKSQKTPKFAPPHFKCKDCKKEIWSTYPGEFVTCDCRPDYIFVDQTEYYGRYGGDPSKFIKVGDDENN